MLTQDIQFQIECLAAELAEMLMAEYGWDILAHLMNYIHQSLSPSLTIPNAASTIKAQSISSNSSNPKSKPARLHNMVKKTQSYSQVQATEALEQLGQRATSASEFIYELLRIFSGYGDGQIHRTKEGIGNLAKDGETVLIKNLVAYWQSPVTSQNGDYSAMYNIINALRGDTKIAKQSPRLYITSNGVHVVAYDPKEMLDRMR